MICEQCKAEGKTSRVFPGRSTSTLMWYGNCQYYDENGVYHDHEPSQRYTDYSCSNGHQWGIKHKNKCPNCDWSD